MILNENTLSEPIYRVTASCTICLPKVGDVFTFQIISTQPNLYKLVSGPLYTILTINTKCNSDDFYVNVDTKLIHYQKDSSLLKTNDCVNIKITDKWNTENFGAYVEGTLHSIATEQQKQQFEIDQKNFNKPK